MSQFLETKDCCAGGSSADLASATLPASDGSGLREAGLTSSRSHSLALFLAGLLLKGSLAIGASDAPARGAVAPEMGRIDPHAALLTDIDVLQYQIDHGLSPLRTVADMEYIWARCTELGWTVYMPVLVNPPGYTPAYAELGFDQEQNPDLEMLNPFYVVKDMSLQPELTPAQRATFAACGITVIEFPVGADAETFATWLITYMCPDCPTDSVGINPPPAAEQPRSFDFIRSYPNPFNPTTSFNLSLPQPADVNIEVINLLGQQLWHWDGHLGSGEHLVKYESAGTASGPQFACFTVSPLLGSVDTYVLPILKLE